MLTLRNVKTQAVALTMAGTIAVSSILGSGIASADSPIRDSNLSFGRVSEDLLSSSRPFTPSSLTELETYHALIRHATHERIISRVNWPEDPPPPPPTSRPTRDHLEPMKTHFPDLPGDGDAAVGIIPLPSLMPTMSNPTPHPGPVAVAVPDRSGDGNATVGLIRVVSPGLATNERVSVEPLRSTRPASVLERHIPGRPGAGNATVGIIPQPSLMPTLDVGPIT